MGIAMRNYRWVAAGAIIGAGLMGLALSGGERAAEAARDQAVTLPLLDMPVEERALVPLIASAFQAAAAGEIDVAVEQLTGRAWAPNDETKKNLKTMFTEVNRAAGAYTGTELVAVRRVSARFTEVWTLSWYAAGPYMFHGRFYQREGEWKFVGFKATHKLDEFLETAPVTFVTRYGER